MIMVVLLNSFPGYFVAILCKCNTYIVAMLSFSIFKILLNWFFEHDNKFTVGY